MKKFIFIIAAFCITSHLSAQLRYAPEFYLRVQDATPRTNETFVLELVSPLAYCYDNEDPSEELFECDDCGSECDECEGSTELIEIDVNGDSNTQEGWGHCSLLYATKDPWFGYGVYKLSHSGSGRFIYLDIRDDRYFRDESCDYGVDFVVLYDANGLPGGGYWEWDYDADDNWNSIDNGALVQIWEESYSMPETDEFPAGFWYNSITMTYNSNGNPRIVWSKHPSFSPISGYKIYRANTEESDPHPSAEDFSLLATLNSSTLFYVDDDVKISETEDDITWYTLKAYYEHPKTLNITYSSATDTTYAYYVEFYKPIVKKEIALLISDYRLNGNYPNPFNPITNISFELPEKSPVKLVVYDIQGKKVVTLVNETLENGNYSVEFNAEHLPSGIYLYKIIAGKFSDSRKMTLVK